MKAPSRPLLFLLLALALLFAQQGAAVHALSHFSEPLPGHSTQDKQLPHSPACEKCVAYAGVGSALASNGLSLPPVIAQTAIFAVHVSRHFPQTVRRYRSRAPPILA